MSFDSLNRYNLEQTHTEEARLVLGALQDIESRKLKGTEAQEALGNLAWSIEAYRKQHREYYKGELDKIAAKYQRNQERNAAAEALKFQQLQTRINAMSDKEALERIDQMERSDGYWNANEVDLLTARLRDKNPEEIESFRDQAKNERRAYAPWAHEGPGAEIYEQYQTVSALQPGKVQVDGTGDGYMISVDLFDLYDQEGEMDSPADPAQK